LEQTLRSPVSPGASGAQLRAALVAARGDDRPAGTGTHPKPEAMGLRPPAVIRLERTLAHWSSRDSMSKVDLRAGCPMHLPGTRECPREPQPWGRHRGTGRSGTSLLTVRANGAQVKLTAMLRTFHGKTQGQPEAIRRILRWRRRRLPSSSHSWSNTAVCRTRRSAAT